MWLIYLHKLIISHLQANSHNLVYCFDKCEGVMQRVECV